MPEGSACDGAPPVNVLHLITDLDIGGAERMLTRLVTGSEPGRVRHHVVSMLSGGAFSSQIADAGCTVQSLGMTRGAVDLPALYRLVRILRRIRPNVLQSWLYHADLMGLVAGRLASIPAIVWNIRCSDMDFRRYPGSTGRVVRILRHLSSFPEAVIANSHAGQAAHRQMGFRPRRWEVIPNGFELPDLASVQHAGRALRGQLRLPPDALLIGLVARYDPMKDHGTFIRAAARLADRWPQVVFVLAGRNVTAENRELAGMIEAAGIGGRVRLLGERLDSFAVLAALDVATSSSAFGEGCPNVIGEAMASAIPCVATAVGDSPGLIGETGLCVPPRDPEALAAAWDVLVRSPGEERTRRGLAGRQRIASRFALRLATERYVSLYEELAGRRPLPRPRCENPREMAESRSIS